MDKTSRLLSRLESSVYVPYRSWETMSRKKKHAFVFALTYTTAKSTRIHTWCNFFYIVEVVCTGNSRAISPLVWSLCVVALLVIYIYHYQSESGSHLRAAVSSFLVFFSTAQLSFSSLPADPTSLPPGVVVAVFEWSQYAATRVVFGHCITDDMHLLRASTIVQRTTETLKE